MDEAKNKGDALEQLAKAAAEGAQFEFNPAAWAAMEQKLAPPKRGFFWWGITGIAGLVLTILLVLFTRPVEQDILNEKQTSELTNDSEKLEEKNSQNNQGAKSSNQEALKEESTKRKLVQGKTEDQNTNSDSNADLSSTNVQANTERATTNDLSSTNAQNNASVVENESEKEEASSESSNDVSYFDVAAQPIGLDDGIDEKAGLYEASFETITPRWIPKEFLFDLSLKPMTLDSGNYQIPDLDSLQQFKRWSFGVLVSLDFSATGLDGFTDPGTMIGLLAEYRISKKWSIQSGVSYSVKKYRALGSEYTTPEWIAARPDDFLGAEAKCLVIDIPINLRRYFTTKKGNQWFVNTGVSTYLMLREDYEYQYTHLRPNWRNDWSISNQNNHFLGVANISVGYETPINKKFGLAIEPFMKLPLTGIGQGRVRFLSFGTNLVIKLR